MRNIIETIGASIFVVLVAIGGLMLILICQPFFWLAIIAIALIIYL